MKYEVGYITAWRRTIFFSLILSIIVFGVVSTVSGQYISAAIVSNFISVGALVLCMALMILVISDKFERYKGYGTAVFEEDGFTYNDRKRHFRLKYNDIQKVDIENIMLGQNSKNPLAYRILIKTEKKKYYIESDRALGRDYTEVDLHRLYLDIQGHTFKA